MQVNIHASNVHVLTVYVTGFEITRLPHTQQQA